ncbi:MAG: glycosyltransferase family 2 protein [Pseudomonadota bacterium]
MNELWRIIEARDRALARSECELAVLRAELAEKEKVIRQLDDRLQSLDGATAHPSGQSGLQVSAECDRLKACLEADRALIEQQAAALKAYRLAYGAVPVFRPLARIVRRIGEMARPRLGNLNQYAPRPLKAIAHPVRTRGDDASPKISIVTPSYGQGSFIEHTLRSVLDQGYPNLEYFVQDGGSRDGTVEVLRRYEQELSGWTSEPDTGQSQAINRGFARTSGDIMAWLNSDDLLLPGTLDRVVEFFRRHPEVDVVYGNRLLIDEHGMEIGRWILPGHDDKVLAWVDYVPQETLFWRRSMWACVGGMVDESFRFAMDWDLLVRFREAGARFAHIPTFLGAFRVHERQKTSSVINETGHMEMNRIRERVLGRVPTHFEIRRAILPYLLRHVCVDMAYRVKARLGSADTGSARTS